jgi:hypothetical protein
MLEKALERGKSGRDGPHAAIVYCVVRSRVATKVFHCSMPARFQAYRTSAQRLEFNASVFLDLFLYEAFGEFLH